MASAVLVLASFAGVSAQRGATGAPPGQPPATQPGGRGGGRGRGGVVVMTLSSPAWSDGGQMPAKYTQVSGPAGEISPPLSWSGAPENTAEFVLIVHDLDAPIGNGTDDLLHWMVWKIPGTA